ncbi:MAG TPA: dihydrofolate reductase family protein [Candidatus Acidoferrales bacterium]|nr:dihydrofolate reductase family protein [Candidatus Acidoferrales bacterium]
MRKVVLGLGISLDGYIARLDGSVDFLFMPKDYSMEPFFKTVDAAIMGRKTLEAGLKMGGAKSFAAYKMDYYICSRTLPEGKRDLLIYTSETPAELVARIRKKSGKDISLMGGGELAREYLRADLVDEIYLGIVPTLLGEGIPLFPSGFPQREFTLLENKTYSKGLIALRYARARKRSPRKSK